MYYGTGSWNLNKQKNMASRAKWLMGDKHLKKGGKKQGKEKTKQIRS